MSKKNKEIIKTLEFTPWESFEAKINPKIEKYHKKLNRKINKLTKDKPCFFMIKSFENIPSIVHKEFEKHFSKKYYTDESAGQFESWSVLSLLKQSMAIGYELGKNPKKWKKKENKLKSLMKLSEIFDFHPLKGKRSYDLFTTRFIWGDRPVLERTDYVFKNGSKISSEFHNSKALSKKTIEKAFINWETKILKVISQKKTLK